MPPQREANERDVLVVGAGVAGLACARDLARSGRNTVVFEKSRGVGGRCATRRVGGQPVDHGLAFYHGSDEAFLEDLEGAAGGEDRLDGWPRKVEGAGRPCQPRALDPREKRVAYRDGATVFPKHLATGLEILRERRVSRLEVAGETIRVHVDASGSRGNDSETWEAGSVVLALPSPQALALVESIRDDEAKLGSARALLDQGGWLPSLTVLAGYPEGTPAPSWDMNFPEESAVLHLASHDSAKRRPPRRLALVYQSTRPWARRRWDDDREGWSREIIEEAGRLFGAWAARPEWVQAHRWRHARADASAELASPVVVRLSGGARLGLAGEAFAPGGGVQAAWRSGREIARRIGGTGADTSDRTREER